MKGQKNLWLLVLCVLSVAGTALIYSRLPEKIPMHWGIEGQIDRYGGRGEIFLTAGVSFLFYGLMLVIPRIDPRRDNYKKHMKAFSLIIAALVLFMIALHWMMVAVALGADINVQTAICLAMAVLFAVIGNVLPQARHNYTFGIRTPWTLADEEVWRKTHRVGGYVFWLMAAALAAAAFIPSVIAFILAIGGIVAGVVFLVVYSYILFEHKEKGGNNHAS